MLRHCLRRGAWHLAPFHAQRDRLDFYHGLLGTDMESRSSVLEMCADKTVETVASVAIEA